MLPVGSSETHFCNFMVADTGANQDGFYEVMIFGQFAYESEKRLDFSTPLINTGGTFKTLLYQG